MLLTQIDDVSTVAMFVHDFLHIPLFAGRLEEAFAVVHRVQVWRKFRTLGVQPVPWSELSCP